MERPEKTPPIWSGPIFDAHVDLPLYLYQHPEISFGDLTEAPFTYRHAKEAGLRVFGAALYCEDRHNGASSLPHLRTLIEHTLDRLDPASPIENLSDLDQTWRNPQSEIRTVLLLENADALAERPAYAETLKEQGVRVFGLTHMGKNRLADGNAVGHSDGITSRGRDVLHTMETNGIILDAAHLHPACFWQALSLFTGPIIDTHTGLRAVLDTPRNLDFEQVREIIDRGGVVGLTLNPEMLVERGECSLEDIFVHLDTLVQKFEPWSIGLGSDFLGFSDAAPELSEIGQIGVLAQKMLESGYGQAAVEAVMGLNWFRFFQAHFEKAP